MTMKKKKHDKGKTELKSKKTKKLDSLSQGKNMSEGELAKAVGGGNRRVE